MVYGLEVLTKTFISTCYIHIGSFHLAYQVTPFLFFRTCCRHLLLPEKLFAIISSYTSSPPAQKAHSPIEVSIHYFFFFGERKRPVNAIYLSFLRFRFPKNSVYEYLQHNKMGNTQLLIISTE